MRYLSFTPTFFNRCETVYLDENLYQKEQPPLCKESHVADVSVKVSISMIGNFNEWDSKFDSRFSIQMEWYYFFKF